MDRLRSLLSARIDVCNVSPNNREWIVIPSGIEGLFSLTEEGVNGYWLVDEPIESLREFVSNSSSLSYPFQGDRQKPSLDSEFWDADYIENESGFGDTGTVDDLLNAFWIGVDAWEYDESLDLFSADGEGCQHVGEFRLIDGTILNRPDLEKRLLEHGTVCLASSCGMHQLTITWTNPLKLTDDQTQVKESYGQLMDELGSKIKDYFFIHPTPIPQFFDVVEYGTRGIQSGLGYGQVCELADSLFSSIYEQAYVDGEFINYPLHEELWKEIFYQNNGDKLNGIWWEDFSVSYMGYGFCMYFKPRSFNKFIEYAGIFFTGQKNTGFFVLESEHLGLRDDFNFDLDFALSLLEFSNIVTNALNPNAFDLYINDSDVVVKGVTRENYQELLSPHAEIIQKMRSRFSRMKNKYLVNNLEICWQQAIDKVKPAISKTLFDQQCQPVSFQDNALIVSVKSEQLARLCRSRKENLSRAFKEIGYEVDVKFAV